MKPRVRSMFKEVMEALGEGASYEASVKWLRESGRKNIPWSTKQFTMMKSIHSRGKSY